MKNIKVCHLSSVHKAFDTRICLRECNSLVRSGFDVYYVVPHSADEDFNGIKIRGVKQAGSSRFYRMIVTTFLVWRKALSTKAHIFHIHDPELIPYGLLLKLQGKKVIFDVHENISAQIKNKNWLPLRSFFSKAFRLIDWVSAKAFYLILAENSYEKLYRKMGAEYVTILNMPDVPFFKPFINLNRSELKNSNGLFYMGSVTFERGIDKIISALKILDDKGVEFKFHCVGPYEQSVMNQIVGLKDFKQIKEKVIFYGWKKLDESFSIGFECKIGLSILKPIENYLESYSTKIFEYMAVGLPFITSDFPLYKNVCEQSKCGFTINPLDSELIAEKILQLINVEETQREFAYAGLKAVNEIYNWSMEEKKLIDFYNKIAAK